MRVSERVWYMFNVQFTQISFTTETDKFRSLLKCILIRLRNRFLLYGNSTSVAQYRSSTMETPFLVGPSNNNKNQVLLMRMSSTAIFRYNRKYITFGLYCRYALAGASPFCSFFNRINFIMR